LKATNAEEFFVKGNALEALTKITTETDIVLPPLIAALKDKRPWIQKTAAIGLGELGPAAKSAIPALKATSTDSSFLETVEVTRAIGMIQGE
jgi:HEAT repeat protein